ncbi:SusC/RagA family TonB-linked outer membrane protein [Flavobacterium azooxidireducens]|uniref:SusC/RagA family TonB-linked outer membrane protein n=1 Tax=Flavobacterium azooxidireducens TaxID=1871076 RepID=A0ABY4KDC2_9FLAO|nr:SusC/RagA family TonB-linked outer membrane protein [Flavobacterium azooxidireducens]UPQ78311.1 SusC/RagA family TonB-linked outer membrane protein [Flavobacterium azooxidireducens]
MNKFSINQKTNPIKYLCILALTLCTLTTTAQTQQPITGTVSDAQGTLPGVTVLIKGKTTGTLTDENGYFSIAANPSDVLVFSYMGYKTQEITVGNQTALNIQLEEDTTQLKEVILNAGYYSVKDKERTGSIARITAKDIETQPVTNVLATMQGRMAGVNITQETGTPGGGFAIQIRGINSLRAEGNAPLYVIDGVPYSSDPIGFSQTSTLFPSVTNPLNNINPQAIENIEVLKDADATAIYGSRGANGVVLITTKKAKVGKTQFNFSASSGVGKATAFMQLMNTQQYLAMRIKAYENDGITNYPNNAFDVNGTWDQNRYTDWQKELLGGTAEISSFQGSVSGGSEKTQFLLGGNYFQQGTVYPGSFIYKKGGINVSMNHTSLNNKFRITFSANYNIQDNDQPANDLTTDARTLAPNAPALYDEDGNLNWENNTFVNPLRFLNAEHKARTDDLVANTVLTYQILPKLSAKTSIGYTTTKHLETRTTPSTIFNPSLGITSESSSLFVTNTQRKSWIVEPQLNYVAQFAKSQIDILAGATFQSQNTSTLSQMGSGFTSNGLIYDLASASINDIFVNNELIYNYQAFFGRINYKWNDKYILNLTGRRDGSSRFGPGNQFANFGAIGGAWIVSNESFLKNSKIISFGKLRASYGTTGSDQIGDYQFLNTYSSAGTQYQNVVGLQPTRLYNPQFGWETNKKLEASIEIGFLNDRIMLSAAIFKNRSSNQLVGIPIPATTGFTSMQANLNATVENRGYEFTLNTVNISNQNFKWSTDINLSILQNELIEFPNLEASVYSQKYRVGHSLNSVLVYNNTGVNPTTGLYEFEDVNGDGQITFPDDKQKVVSLNPDFFGGINNHIKYKNWSLDFLFQFIKQNNTNISLGAPGRRNFNQPVRFNNSWQQQGDQSAYQMYTSGTNSSVMSAQSLYENSDSMITDASFIRLKNIALSYSIPLNKINTQCKLVVEAQNLLTFTKYKDGDPEFTSAGFLPPLRIINAGVQFQF